MTTTPFTTFGFRGTLGVTNRTTPDRISDVFNVMDFGAVGTGTPTPLSTRYGSLAAAQAVYPFVTSTTQECDYAAIQLALNTMWATIHKGGILFLPVGNYLTNDEIDIGNHQIGSNNTYGIIEGSGSFLGGNVPNGFIFYQDDGINGPAQINNLILSNTSTNIGSGALRINNTSAEFNGVGFVGMIGALTPFNIYDVRFNHCGSSAHSDLTTGYNGTLGIAGSAFSVNGWRTTSVTMAMFSLQGSDTAHMSSIGVENCVVVFLVGAKTGWAGNCTVSGNILTVGGKVGSLGDIQFSPGQILFMKGLNLPAWGSDPFDSTGGVTIVTDGTPTVTDGTTTLSGSTMTVNGISSNGYGLRVGGLVEGTGVIAGTTITAVPGTGNYTTGNYTVTPGGQSAGPTTITATDAQGGVKLTGLGFTGTYRISGSYTISTPVPLWSRAGGHVNCVDVSAVQGEANFCQVYIYNLGGGNFEDMGSGGTVIECPDQFGTTGLTARCGFYIRSGTAFTLKGCVPAANNYQGTFVIAPDATLTNISFISCTGKKFDNNVITATISNGSGGAGKILNVATFTSGSGIGVGMKVYDGAVLQTTITKNHLLDPTYTGSITTGTYEVADSLNLSSRTLTVRTGEGWVVDLMGDVAKPGVRFFNCGTSNLPGGAIYPGGPGYTDGLEKFNMTFAALPGQVSGSNTSFHQGMSYFIVDAQKSGTGTAVPGDIVQGGGSQKIPIFYDGTNWRYGGSGQFG